jgi:hypothetical protein
MAQPKLNSRFCWTPYQFWGIFDPFFFSPVESEQKMKANHLGDFFILTSCHSDFKHSWTEQSWGDHYFSYLPILFTIEYSLQGPRCLLKNPNSVLRVLCPFSFQKAVTVSILFLLPKPFKLACHSFVDSGKRHETPGSEKKDLSTPSTSSSLCFVFMPFVFSQVT